MASTRKAPGSQGSPCFENQILSVRSAIGFYLSTVLAQDVKGKGKADPQASPTGAQCERSVGGNSTCLFVSLSHGVVAV